MVCLYLCHAFLRAIGMQYCSHLLISRLLLFQICICNKKLSPRPKWPELCEPLISSTVGFASPVAKRLMNCRNHWNIVSLFFFLRFFFFLHKTLVWGRSYIVALLCKNKIFMVKSNKHSYLSFFLFVLFGFIQILNLCSFIYRTWPW